MAGELTLPDRALRRLPTDSEIRAAVQFEEIDRLHDTTSEAAVAWLRSILPEQIAQLLEQITTTRQGEVRKRLTKLQAAKIKAPVLGEESLVELLLSAARGGAVTAQAEAAAQGIPLVGGVVDEDLIPAITEQAAAVAQQHADAVSLSASRRAVQTTTPGRAISEVASDLALHMQTLQMQWSQDQLAGATQMAINSGRLAAMSKVEAPTRFAASELLDTATCDPCRMIDGTEWDSIVDAQRVYGSGGYVDCKGGPRCRGTAIAIYDELGDS